MILSVVEMITADHIALLKENLMDLWNYFGDWTTYSHVHKHHHDQDCDQNLTQKDTIHLPYESFKYEIDFL